MTHSALVPAEMMARVVSQDPQFRLPNRPRFAREFAVALIQGGLVVEGAEERQVLRGAAATTLAPRLINHLDGTRTIDELVSLLPDVPVDHIQAALALLYTRGLLEDGDCGEPGLSPGANPNTLSFLRRHVDVTRINKSAVQAYGRLERSNVLVVADDLAAGQALAKELTACGAPRVRVLDKDFDGIPVDSTLVVALGVSADDNWMDRIDDIRLGQGIPWVRFTLDSDTLQSGPYFDVEADRCFRCFRSTCAGRHFSPPDHWAVELVTCTAATEVVYLLTQVVSSRIVNEMTVMNLSDGTLSRRKVIRRPGCSRCLPGGQSSDQLPMPLVYEDAVDLPPKKLVNLKQHQVHYNSHNIALQRVAKRYPNARTLALPSVSPQEDMNLYDPLRAQHDEVENDEITQAIQLKRLSTLLQCTGGVKQLRADGTPVRWASTGGNLGSVGLYLVAQNVNSLPIGLYYYSPFEHRLVELPLPEGDLLDLERLLGTASHQYEDAAAFVVMTGSYGRMSAKYFALGYRLLHLDAGVAAAQALAVAAACGMSAFMLQSWDDEILHSIFQIDGFGELVTGVMAVFGHGGLLP